MQRKTLLILGGGGALLLVLLFVVVRRSASATVPDAGPSLAGVGGIVGGGGSASTSFIPAPATPAPTPTPPLFTPGEPSIPKGIDPRRLRLLLPTPTPQPPAPETPTVGQWPSIADVIRIPPIVKALPIVGEDGSIIGTAKKPAPTPPPKVAVDEPKVSAPLITDPSEIDIVPAIKGKAADLLNFRPPSIKTVGGL